MPQSELFQCLHAEVLKRIGFRRQSTRSERALGPLHQAVVCVSSRFNSLESIDFSLELRVGHEAFFRLFQPGKPFPGLNEKFGPLLSWRLRDPITGNEKWWHLSGSADLKRTSDEVIECFKQQGLPTLEQTKDVPGIIAFCRSSTDWSYFRAHSWSLYHLGHVERAHSIVDEAIKNAPHANARNAARDWRIRISG